MSHGNENPMHFIYFCVEVQRSITQETISMAIKSRYLSRGRFASASIHPCRKASIFPAMKSTLFGGGV